MNSVSEMLPYLRCPRSGGTLRLVQAGELGNIATTSESLPKKPELYLVCDQSSLAYPVIDDIPVLLVESALRLTGSPHQSANEP